MRLQEEQKERWVSVRGMWVLVALLGRRCHTVFSFTLLPTQRSSLIEVRNC